MRLTPPLLAAALALTIAGCGDDGAGPGPTAPQSSSSTQSPQSETTTPAEDEPTDTESDSPAETSASQEEASPSSTPTDTGKPFDPEEFTGRLEAAVQQAQTVRIDVEVQMDETLSASADGVQDLKRNALDMDVDLGGQQLGYRLVDGQYYLAQPPKWVPVEEDSDNPLIEQTLAQIQILSMRNQLDAFIAGVEQAGVKGKQDVGGVTTTHYTATVDAQRSLSELGMDQGEGTPDKVIYDVWLDKDDLIRKMSFSQNGAIATMTATDWGEPVTIDKPTGSQLAQTPDTGTP